MNTQTTAGLVLAAGAGRRFGRPKALVPGWLADRVAALRSGGCVPVAVVLGAQAEQARTLTPTDADVVVAEDWATGMGASLRAGLDHLVAVPATAVVVVLVDLPGLTPAAVRRVREAADSDPSALVQATYGGEPGHPVLLGRDHWPGVKDVATGDRGARAYLTTPEVVPRVMHVECSDVADGHDVDTSP